LDGFEALSRSSSDTVALATAQATFAKAAGVPLATASIASWLSACRVVFIDAVPALRD
jgi:hypothetical protein